MKERGIRFAFAADPHVLSEKTRDWLVEDLARIQDVDFIVLGGDLTWSGTPQELQWYSEAIAAASVPVYSVFGGHDGNALLAAGSPDPTMDYRQQVGPLWYAFDAGLARCLVYVPDLDLLTPGERDYLSPEMREEQARWLKEEIGALSPERPLLVFQHMPTTAPLPAPLRVHRPTAILTGHWHLFKTYLEDDLLFVSVPPLAVTGFTGMPRGFLRCCLEGDELKATYQPLLPERDERRGALLVPASDVALKPDDDWPDFYGGPAGRLRIRAPGRTFRVAWVRQLAGKTLLNSPVISRGRVVFATPGVTGRGGGVACFDAGDGAALWEQALNAAVLHTPAVAGDQVLLLSIDGRVTALDLENGGMRWKADVDAGNHRWVGHGLTACNGRAYLRTPQRVVALDLADGHVVWQAVFAHSDWMGASGAPLCAQGRLFVPALLGDGVSCFDSDTGRLLWNAAGERGLRRVTGGLGYSRDHNLLFATGFVSRPRDSLPSTNEGWPDSFQSTLFALRVDNGRKAWERSVGPYNYSAPVVARGMALLSDTVTGRLLAFDAATGDERWCFQTGSALQCTATNRRDVPSLSSTPAVGGEVVYIGAADGYMYAVNLRTGAEISRTDLGAAIASSPAISGNGLFVATCAGALYGLCGDTQSSI